MDSQAEIKKKHIRIGFVIGMIAPVLAAPIVNWILFIQYPIVNDENGMSKATTDFWEYFINNFTHPYKLPIFLSFCVLVNAIIIFILARMNKDFIMKGMLFPIIIYAFVVFLLKLGL